MFQVGAFQSNAFQQSHYSGGYGGALGQGFLDAMNNADRLRRVNREIDKLPEPVQEVIRELIPEPKRADRSVQLRARLDAIDANYKAMYLELLNRAHDQYVMAQIEMQRAKKRRDDEELIIVMSLLA
jgi:hypothetical protein